MSANGPISRWCPGWDWRTWGAIASAAAFVLGAIAGMVVIAIAVGVPDQSIGKMNMTTSQAIYRIYFCGLRLFTNQVIYLIYFFGLILIVAFRMILASGRRWRRRCFRRTDTGLSVQEQVKRGDKYMNVLHSVASIVIVALNVGIGHIVFTELPHRITRFSFAMMVIETVALFYILYLDPLGRRIIMKIAEALTIEK